MALTRRTALAIGGAGIVALGFGLTRADLLRRDLQDAIETSFSPQIAEHAETARFLDDLFDWIKGLNNLNLQNSPSSYSCNRPMRSEQWKQIRNWRTNPFGTLIKARVVIN